MGNCSIQPTPFIQVGDYEFNPNDVMHMSHHGVLFQGSPRDDKLFEIAIKQINYNYEPSQMTKVETFLKKFMTLRNDNVANYIDYYYDNRSARLYIIVEFCAHGTLSDMIQNDLSFSPLRDLKTAMGYCHQLINGVISLHESGIIHQNLRPQNVLIHYDTLKISDYGLTELEKLSEEGMRKKSSIYKAPELFVGNREATEKCDIWSLGVIMYQLVYRKRPVEVNSGRYVFSEIETGKSATFDDLVAKCLELDPSRRIGLEELKNHPFVRQEPMRLKEIALQCTGAP